MKSENTKPKAKLSSLWLILWIILLFSFLLFILFEIINKYQQKDSFENFTLSFADNNQNTIFSVDEITFFSSSNCKNKASSQTNFTLENLYTYTDIAFFINNHSEEHTSENTLKSLKISNLKYTTSPSVGTPSLYYKDLNNFTKSELLVNNKIESELEFKITSNDFVDYKEPILYNNGANPITLCYQNENIKSDYTITNTSTPITYDGSLLQKCNVSLDTLICTISFDIDLINQKNQKFKASLYFSIPYEEGDNSILKGSITVKKQTNFKFYRYE